MKNIIKQIIWFLLDKCTTCGGALSDWSVKKSFCNNCKKEN